MNQEAPIWQAVAGEWRPLYGGIATSGCSVELHRFHLKRPMAWHESFHPNTLEVCLNMSGRGIFEHDQAQQEIGPRMAAFYFTGQERFSAFRVPGEEHAFLTIEITLDYLKDLLGKTEGLQPWIKPCIHQKPSDLSSFVHSEPMPGGLFRALDEWAQPPVLKAAQDCWFRARVLDLAALFFFAPADQEQELFCSRQKRVARERTARAKALLDADLAEPPRVEEVARQIGCSPSYLSRIFSAEAGMTMPQYLRQRRLERAAELLRTGRHNVTEAALEVGYSSLSHFSKAFWEQFGCCPGLYPQGASVFDRHRADPDH